MKNYIMMLLMLVPATSWAQPDSSKVNQMSVGLDFMTHGEACGGGMPRTDTDDLEKEDLARVKLAIVPGSFYLPAERRAALRDVLLRDGRTVLWLGPCGIDDGATLDLARVEETTGAEYGVPGIVKKDRVGFFGEGDGEWRSVAVSNHDDATVDVLREVAQKAGVLLYVDDGSPVYASERLVAVHTKEGGVKKITLPRKVAKVTEAFSGRLVAENAQSFEYEFAAPETALFELEF